MVALVTTLEFLERLQEALAETLQVAEQGLPLGVLDRWSVTRLQPRLASPFRPTVYDAGRFYSVGEGKQLLQMAAGGEAHVVRHPTLFPRG